MINWPDLNWIPPTIVAITGLVYTIKSGKKTRDHVDSATEDQTSDLIRQIQELKAQISAQGK